MKSQVTGEFNLSIGNRELKVQVVSLAEFVADSHYGSDADGKRGTYRLFLESLNFRIFDFRNNEITNKIKHKYKRTYKDLEELLIDMHNE
jgi:hypothetical protein